MTIALVKNIGTLLESAANEREDKIALRFQHLESVFSYETLNKRVNQFANTFRAMGIQKGDHVGVMLSNCPEFPCTWLALAKLGAVMVPINNGYQPRDLEYVLNDSDSVALVIEDRFLPKLQTTKTPDIRQVFTVGDGACERPFERLAPLVSQASEQFTMPEIGHEDLLNIQYTSGTTGMPKGCLLTHEYWLLGGAVPAQFLTPDDIFLTVTPFYYMDPQWQLIMTLTAKSTLVMAPKYSASNYMKWISQYGITVSWATMGAWTLKQPASDYDQNHRLRFMLVGGFPPALQQQFETRFKVKTREVFGMTEIGPGMMVPMSDSHMTGSGSVGKPFVQREVKIVDEWGNRVGPGETGELLVKGPGLFKGYYKNPGATEKVMHNGWFKTGDLFHQDAQGYYYIAGRIKDMIRRAGENISAREVEGVLTSHPGIQSAAVVPVPDKDRGEEVKAYIQLADGKTPEDLPPQAIIAYCRERIASFKIPRFIVYRSLFPVTPTGKIRKHLLAEDQHSSTPCFDRMADPTSNPILGKRLS